MKRITMEEEYNKNKHIKPDDVKSLLEWAAKQSHLPKITDLEAICFLSCYSGSLESAKNLVEIYYTSRTHCPEFYENRIPKNLVNDMNVVLFHHFHSSDTNQSSRALYTVFVDTDPSKFEMNAQIKILGMVFDLWQQQEGSIDDYQFVIDMKGVQLGMLAKLSIVSMKKSLYILQEALPIKISCIHVINVLPLADKVLALARPFIKNELMDKIIFHTEGIHSLYKHISKTCLPKDLGGDGPTIKELHDTMKTNLLENEDYFKEEELTKRADESKRVGKQKNSGDLFGMEGSFKKLDID